MKKKFWKKVGTESVKILEKGTKTRHEFEEKTLDRITRGTPVEAASKFWKKLGPGLTTGAADDDPSGIATYSQMGASQGFSLIWITLWTLPLMTAVQEMCARIGLATGVGLAANIKRYYSKKVLYVCTALLLFANVFNIGANLGAMAKSAQLLWPVLPFSALILFFAIFSLVLQIFVPYKRYAGYLKYLTFVLFSYIAVAFFIEIDWSEVFLRLTVPNFEFNSNTLMLICAALGTTISPYLFFWQSSQEVEEQILRGEKTEAVRRLHTTEEDIQNMREDVFAGMFVSNLVAFFIIAVCAAMLFSNGITNIATATDAALALKPLAGDFAFALFAVGIIGTGLLAIPVLAGSSSYAISESFGWRTGLYRTLKQATAFYGVILVAMLLGIGLNFLGLDPIKTLIYSAVLNGLIAPVMIFFIIQLAGSEKVMGRWKSGRVITILGWITFVFITLAGLGALLSPWLG